MRFFSVILMLSVLFVFHHSFGVEGEACPALTPHPANVPSVTCDKSNGLDIVLETDRELYERGDSGQFRIHYLNRSAKPFRIYLCHTFSEPVLIRNEMKDFPCEGIWMWSPKRGIYTGKTVLILPGESYRVTRLFTVGEDFRLNLRDGRYYPTEMAGKYILHTSLVGTELDPSFRLTGSNNPEEQSFENLWLGRAKSNQVTIELR